MKKLILLSLMTACVMTPAANAKVTPNEAKKLRNELTPMGAERAGNKEGTIPAWTGGIKKTPKDYKPGEHHRDPFVSDKPLLTITQSNYRDYADHLTAGQIALIKQYPDYKINVYPTHRSASFPQKIYDFSIKNATKAELTQDGAGLKNASVGVPFPIPQNGLEAIWNHLTRYRGDSIKREYVQVTPTEDGNFNPVKFEQESLQYYAQEHPERDNFLFLYKQRITSPAALAGEVLLVHETSNQVVDPRRAWRYDPGRRRAFRTPTVAYDAPALASDGLATIDNFDMFSGSPDRYNWELKGKKEIFVPYNAYRLHSDQLDYEDIIRPGHINQDLTRYELHRVWVVEATLKELEDNIYSRRTFYLDEDSWQALLVDHYDEQGQLWRVGEAHAINYYEVPVLWSTLDVLHDLKAQRYIAYGLDNQEDMYDFSESMTYRQFTSSALRREGR
ncbi:DUF1329 domain-containing protein [Kangiella sediminilitoris]|uniref:Outer membrane lipoprotein-sorting protein n=1 Tax=Kangiella sediminilitoris TaxID=1144748 RepID=A0A1B3BBE9_9GAMM|nr:DUF1329 domain-containing protein [Kangiella sediminilitoris]AOE50106.1 hypothetical protein KS2013_1394 [Kangiella sediminilitoris]